MDPDASWLALVVGLFLGFDLLMVAVRSSMFQAHLPQLLDLRENNPAQVDQTISLLEQPYLRASLRLAVAMQHFMLAGAVWMLFMYLTGLPLRLWLLVVVMLVAALLTLLLEFLVEGVVLREAEVWAVRLTSLARLTDWLLRPAAWLLMRLLGPTARQPHGLNTVTEDELKTWLEEEQPEGGLEKGERKMIYSIFQFGDTLCREIMVPRIDVLALDANMPLSEAIDSIMQSGHSRLPVYEETIDNVIGVLHAKDLLRANPACEGQPDGLRSFIRSAYFVPEAKKVDELLREMQDNGTHMAIVVDEYGGVAGLVTLEDIVEEIVGEIRDEYDQSEEAPYQQISLDEYLLQGRMSIDDLNEVLDTHISKEVAETLGGFLYGEMGRVPTGGERVVIDGWTLVVELVSGRRIRKVRAHRTVEQQSEEEAGDAVNGRTTQSTD